MHILQAGNHREGNQGRGSNDSGNRRARKSRAVPYCLPGGAEIKMNKDFEICECGHDFDNHLHYNPELDEWIESDCRFKLGEEHFCPCKKFKPVQSPETKPVGGGKVLDGVAFVKRNSKDIKKDKTRDTQSQAFVNGERRPDLDFTVNADALRGIFDTTDLEKETIYKAKTLNFSPNKEKDRLFSTYRNFLEYIELHSKLQERQRLKAEVEKVLDDWQRKFKLIPDMTFSCETYGLHIEELKKRLGIK